MDQLNVVLRLRRDNEYNYSKIKDTFVPANGEICLVDTPKDGLRAVCGDGVSTFGKLEYLNDLIVRGYYKDNTFYKDAACTIAYTPYQIKIYIDLQKNIMYYYNGSQYVKISGDIATSVTLATADTPGIMKLYSTKGTNTDGTMTQKAICEELGDKVEVTLDMDDELLVFQ